MESHLPPTHQSVRSPGIDTRQRRQRQRRGWVAGPPASQAGWGAGGPSRARAAGSRPEALNLGDMVRHHARALMTSSFDPGTS
eukprot:6961940-Prymnesium_polylepis.1